MKSFAQEVLNQAAEHPAFEGYGDQVLRDGNAVLERLDEVIKGPSTCQNVDLLELEGDSVAMLASAADFMINIDLSDSQFDLEALFEEAQKIGMDLGDLTEYGFDARAMRCAS